MLDKVVTKLVGLGVPGLILLVVISTSGLAGAAAITAALATLGGPLGMLGGIGVLGVAVLVSHALAEYGLERIFSGVVDGLVKKGMTRTEIERKIRGYPISKRLKARLIELLKQYFRDEEGGLSTTKT